MAGPFSSLFASAQAKHASSRNRSEVPPRRDRFARDPRMSGAVIASSAAIAIAMLPLATPASAGTAILTLGATTGATTTGAVVNFSWNANGEPDAYFIEAFYEPSGTGSPGPARRPAMMPSPLPAYLATSRSSSTSCSPIRPTTTS